jgi:hypothetical protein
LLVQFDAPDNQIMSLAFNIDGDLIYCGMKDGQIVLVRASDGVVLRSQTVASKPITAIAVFGLMVHE